ncbi:Peptidase M23 [Tenacibaculum litopenaei]
MYIWIPILTTVAKLDKNRKLKQKLTDKYRLVILNEDTFQERFSLKLSRLNVFVFGGLFSIVLIVLTTFLIAFTSLREYIPGYSSTKLKTDAKNLLFKVDTLQRKLNRLENYALAIRPVLTGDIKAEKIDSILELSRDTAFNDSRLLASKEDSLFREEIERESRFGLSDGALERAKTVFFSPLTGTISQNYNIDDKHFAVDIVAQTGTPVKAVADGRVVMSEWTAETGYVIIIQHPGQYISVYKHNGTLLKEQGAFVKSGEVIATVGSTGELTTGPHLHFELWHDAHPVNPTNYIDFQ